MSQRLIPISAVVLLVSLLAILMPPATASEVQPLTLDAAVQIAYNEGPESKRAELELAETLLQAANLEHQHQLGAPGRQTIRIDFDLGTLGELLDEWIDDFQPPRMSIPIGGPSDMERAQIEEVLPIQFAALRQTAGAAYDQRMGSIRTQIIDAYYARVLAEGNLEVQERAFERLTVQQEQVRALYDQGMIPHMDLIQMEMALASAHAERLDAQDTVTLASASLNRRLGRPLGDDITLRLDPIPLTPPEGDLGRDEETARAASAEITALEGQLAVAEKELDLFGRYKGTFTRRRTYHEYELAVERKELELHDAERNVELAVLATESRLTRAFGQLGARDQQQSVAERGLEAVQLKYEAGLTTITDVLEAQNALLGAELAHLSATVEILSTKADRDTLLGRVGPYVADRRTAIETRIGELR